MRFKLRTFVIVVSALATLATARIEAADLEIQWILGTPQAVPPVIDIGLVKPGRSQSVTQTLINSAGVPLPIQAVQVVAGDFTLVGPSPTDTTLPSPGSFAVTVATSGQTPGVITGQLEIQWGAPYGSTTVALTANVDLVDWMAPSLAFVATGFEQGSLAPFAVPASLPAPQITTGAALVGAHGLAVAHTGGTTPSFLQYFFPSPREVVRGLVTLNPNGLVLEIPEAIAAVNDYGLPLATLELRRKGTGYQLRVLGRLDDGTTAPSAWVGVPTTSSELVFDWWAGHPGEYQGGVRVRCGAGCSAEVRSASLNFSRARNLRFGAVSGVAASTVGSFFLDEVGVRY